jgi:hypothetical protein
MNPIRQTVFFILLSILATQNLFSQDSIKVKKVKILPVPTFGYSPETKTYIGVVSLFTIDLYQDSITRSSNAKVEFNYTWNKQIILENEWNYFFKDEAWFTQGLLHYSKYPDIYYGIGDNTPNSAEVNFESTRIKADIDLLKNISDKWFAGIGLNYYNFTDVSYVSPNLVYPELKDESNWGLKLILLKDSRNNILTPANGTYLKFVNSFKYSETFYDQITLDLRQYYSLGQKQDQTIAGRFYQSSVLNTPPFYDYSLMGGDKLVRGYYAGRYRDKNLTSLQLEYRVNLFWKIGLATFAGVSAIYPDLSSISPKTAKPNLGVGLRFLVDKKENTSLRFDYAVGSNDQSGFYVSFGESF